MSPGEVTGQLCRLKISVLLDVAALLTRHRGDRDKCNAGQL